MNIGICLLHKGEDMENVFANAAKIGFHHGQLVSWDPTLWTQHEAEQILCLSDKYDIRITAFWCGWEGPKKWDFTDGPETLGLVPEAYRFHRLQNLLDGAAFARRLGVQDVVTHMGFLPESSSDPQYQGICAAIRAIAVELRTHDQNLLFETGQETPVALLRVLEEVGTGNLFVNLDPANLIMYGKANPVDALDVLRGYVRGIHAKDGRYPTSGYELGEEVKVGTGKVDFPALLYRLKADGYDGSLTIEREIEGEEQTRDIIETKMYLQSILDEIENSSDNETKSPAIRVGMIGMGGISQSHIEGWKHIPEASITAVCDIRTEMAESAAHITGAKAYCDFDCMLKNEQLDVLDICLPTYLHAEYAKKGLKNGLHVICEKPVSLNKKDVREIYDAARAVKKCFMVAQVLRFWPEYIAVKEAYDHGTYGKLLSGQMSRLGNVPGWSWNNWMRDPEKSGLVPFDLHIHDLDFLVYVFGRPENLICHRGQDEIQDYLHVTYEYKDFFISTEASWYNCDFRFMSSYRFQFEHAVMCFERGKLTVYKEDGKTEVRKTENRTVNGINLPGTSAYYNELRYFTDCVISGSPCQIVCEEELETVLEIIKKLDA